MPKEWADKYAVQFDDGWDALRERTFAKQKELGVIPADAELTARHDEITAWDDMPEELKPVLARQMEVYAVSSASAGIAQLLLPCDGALPLHVPAVVELAGVLVGPLLRHVVRSVGRPGAK